MRNIRQTAAPTPAPAEQDRADSIDGPLVVGIVIGGLFGMLCLIFTVWFFCVFRVSPLAGADSHAPLASDETPAADAAGGVEMVDLEAAAVPPVVSAAPGSEGAVASAALAFVADGDASAAAAVSPTANEAQPVAAVHAEAEAAPIVQVEAVAEPQPAAVEVGSNPVPAVADAATAAPAEPVTGDSGLPPFWSVHQTEDGQTYWFNTQTLESQWTPPIA